MFWQKLFVITVLTIYKTQALFGYKLYDINTSLFLCFDKTDLVTYKILIELLEQLFVVWFWKHGYYHWRARNRVRAQCSWPHMQACHFGVLVLVRLSESGDPYSQHMDLQIVDREHCYWQMAKQSWLEQYYDSGGS